MASKTGYSILSLAPGITLMAGSFLTTDGYTSTGTGWESISTVATGITGGITGRYKITHDKYAGVIAAGAWIEEDTANDTGSVRIHSTDPTNGYTYLQTQTSAGVDADLNAQSVHFMIMFRNTDITV